MPEPTLEGVALRHYRRASGITRRVTEAMLQAWEATGPAGFADQMPRVSLLLATGQLAQVLESVQYLRDVAQVQGLDAATSVLRPSGLVGRTAAGVPLHEVLQAPVARVSALVESGVDVGTAAQSGAAILTRLVSNEVTQTGTNATQIGMAGNPEFRGYIRMMKPPSCSRCAVMAGSWWEWNDGFPRHPGCDCIHVPAGDVQAGDSIKVNPKEYFDSLSEADQDKYFGKAQADAIRGGANLGRTVNAHARAAGLREFDAGGMPAGPQMTPRQVFQTAGADRGQAVRLLHDNGYLEPVEEPSVDTDWVEPPIDPKWEGQVWDGDRTAIPWGYRVDPVDWKPHSPWVYKRLTPSKLEEKRVEARRQHKMLQAVQPGPAVKPKPWRDPPDPENKTGRPPKVTPSFKTKIKKVSDPGKVAPGDAYLDSKSGPAAGREAEWSSLQEILAAVRVYTENGARLANTKLRSGDYIGDRDSTDLVIRGLDRLFDEFPAQTTSKADMTLYRGVYGRELVDRLEPGATLFDAGYTSTASHVGMARGFASGQAAEGAVLVIRAPAGTRMLNAGLHGESVGIPGAVELVLQRGTTLRVVSRRLDRSGRYAAPGEPQIVIECEIV